MVGFWTDLCSFTSAQHTTSQDHDKSTSPQPSPSHLDDCLPLAHSELRKLSFGIPR